MRAEEVKKGDVGLRLKAGTNWLKRNWRSFVSGQNRVQAEEHSSLVLPF